jgi:hypothetical protein
MSVVEQPRSQGLFARAINILMRPKPEWDVISAEPATVPGLFIGYAAILAALPAIARIVNGIMPHCFFGVACYTPNPVFAVIGGIVSYLVSLAGVFVTGLIIDALAPNFGGQKNQIQAMKVAVYSWTAAWLAGFLVIVPFVGVLLALAGLYSLYLLYLGLGQVMKSPADKQVAYSVVVVVIAIVVFLIGGAIVGAVTAAGVVTGGISGPGQLSQLGSVHINAGNGSGATIDLNRLQASAKEAEASIKAAEAGNANGKVNVIDPQQLKALLPDNIGGAPRVEVSASSGGAAGLGASDAEATYQSGDAHITLKVTDLAAIGGLTAFAGALNVQSDKETATGYDKTQTINGQIVHEQYDNQSKSGEYTVVVGNRFSIEADGSNVPIETLKAAVAAVGPDRLAALAHS